MPKHLISEYRTCKGVNHQIRSLIFTVFSVPSDNAPVLASLPGTSLFLLTYQRLMFVTLHLGRLLSEEE